MRTILSGVFVILISTILNGQIPKHDVHWLIPGTTNLFEFDFSSGSLTPIVNSFQQNEVVDSIGFRPLRKNILFSDRNGDPLVFHSGCFFFDLEGNIVPGSEEMVIAPGTYNCIPSKGDYESNIINNISIVPTVDANKYTVLYLNRNTSREIEFVPSKLYACSLIFDNNGPYIDVNSITQLYNFQGWHMEFTDFIASPDPSIWWVIQQTALKDSINILRVDIENLQLLDSQKIASLYTIHHPGPIFTAGEFEFSPDGQWLMSDSYYYGTHIFSFDRETGDLEPTYHIPLNDYMGKTQTELAGAVFSPNSQDVLWYEGDRVFSYDLYADNFIQSRTLVFDRPIPYATPQNNLTEARLGPDCKIYFTSRSNIDNEGRYWSLEKTWNNDSVIGVYDNYIYTTDPLRGVTINYPFNKFPQYRVNYPWDALCDFTTSTKESVTPSQTKIYPNPISTYQKLTIEIQPTCATGKIFIYNQLGQLVLTRVHNTSASKLDISNLKAGIYYLSYRDCNQRLHNEKLIIL